MKTRLIQLRAIGCAMLACFLLGASIAGAQSTPAPAVIPFQGLLTTQSGTPVPDGSYSVIFNLYDRAVGGQPVWSERHGRIGVTHGRINVFIGSQPGNPVALSALDFAVVKYLGITIDTDDRASTPDPEMTPRQIIVPPWYALKTPRADRMAGYSWSAFLTGADPATAVIQGNRFTAGSVPPGALQPGAIRANLAADGMDTFISSSSNPPDGYESIGPFTLFPGGPWFYLHKKAPAP